MSLVIDEIVASDLKAIAKQADLSSWSGKRLLVTGGAGFLGSWLCDALVNAKAAVVGIDDMSTGVAENITELRGKPSFSFVEESVMTMNDHGHMDAILHFASHASPDEYQRRPIETLTVNSEGTHILLDHARRNDAKFLYASTSETYGDATIIPTPETYWGNVSSTGPRSCYDEGKRYGEALCMAYYKTYGLDVKVIRIFNTYGPRLRADGYYGRALSRFIRQALSGSDITVHGDGKQTRSFCYVTDTISGALRALESSRMRGEVVNIGSPNEVTILELAKMIQAAAASESKITFHPRPAHDPQRRCPDISRAKQTLGWVPSVSLTEGLSRTMEWFARNQKAG